MRQLTHVGPSRDRAEEMARAAARAAARPAGNPPPCDGAFWPCAPAALVRIYEIEKELTFPRWLCPAAARQLQAEGWRIRLNRAPPFDDLRCDFHRGEGCGR